jgi:predicted Fe-S protein YdhL (DUF1289 family)
MRPSPCVKICTYDPARDLCTGCGRTLEEIGDWLELSEAERQRITAELPKRLAKITDQRS